MLAHEIDGFLSFDFLFAFLIGIFSPHVLFVTVREKDWGFLIKSARRILFLLVAVDFD